MEFCKKSNIQDSSKQMVILIAIYQNKAKLFIYKTPKPRAGCETRSIFYLNSEFLSLEPVT